MQNFIESICIKGRLDPSKILKKPIRGLKGIVLKDLIEALLLTDSMEEAAKRLGYTLNPVKQAVRESLSSLFPERTHKFGDCKGMSSWRYTLLYYIDHKKCWACSRILPLKDFYSDRGKSDNLSGDCNPCHIIRKQQQKLFIRQRTPSWSEAEKIEMVYRMCPKGMQVDHIIPLRGKLVSGLHVIENLQYLTTKANLVKSNKYEI